MSARPGSRMALAGLLALVTFIAFESIAVATAMPAVAAALRIGVSYSLAFSLFLTGSLAGQGAAGAWSDRSGPTRPLLTGTLTFSAGLLLSGLAPGVWLLLTGRLVAGVGAGMVLVALYVVVAEVFDEQDRPRVFGLMSAAWVVPSLVGPLVAAWLAETVSWRAVFVLVVPLALVAAGTVIPALRRLPPAPGRVSSQIRRRTGYAMVVATGSLLVPWGLRPGLPWALRLVLVVAGLALIAVYLPRLLPPGTLRGARGLPAVIGVRAVTAGCYFGAETYLPLAVHTVRGMLLVSAGLALTAASIGWALGSWVQSRDPGLGVARVKWLLAGAVLVTGGITLLPTTMHVAVTPWVVIGIWALAAVGMGFAYATANVVVMALTAPGEQGRNGAALQVGEALGSITGVALAGLLHNELTGRVPDPLVFSVLWWALAGLSLLAVVLAARVRPRT